LPDATTTPVLAGEGDNRFLSSNHPAAIRRMVEQMVETGRMSGGYFMCIGNHIPWNVPGGQVALALIGGFARRQEARGVRTRSVIS